jgi:hypothetical protein
MKQSRNTAHLKPWKPGQSGNPLGRPLGARSKFSEAAAQDALADWLANGSEVLARVRKKDPSTYLRVLFSIIPRDVALSVQHHDGPYSPEERRTVRRLLDAIETSGAAMGVDLETVFAWIEDDLRARAAKSLPTDAKSAAPLMISKA